MSFYDDEDDVQFLAKKVAIGFLERVENAPGKKVETRDDNGKLHSFNDEPARAELKRLRGDSFFVLSWYSHGRLHRVNGPAVTEHSRYELTNGSVYAEEKRLVYYENGKMHREDGPAFIHHNGQASHLYKWYYHGKLHRENSLPALMKFDSDAVQNVGWFHHGKISVSTLFSVCNVVYGVSWENHVKKREYGVVDEGKRQLVSCAFTPKNKLRVVTWNKSDHLYEPVEIEYNMKNQITRVQYDSSHKDWDVSKPCETSYYPNGTVKQEVFMRKGKRHSIVGPAVMNYNKEGFRKDSGVYYVNGVKCGDLKE